VVRSQQNTIVHISCEFADEEEPKRVLREIREPKKTGKHEKVLPKKIVIDDGTVPQAP
jgi:hypothetical protein